MQGLQRLGACLVIDRTAVVRIDQAEVPHLAALVDVGHARHGQLEHGLDQAVLHAEPGHAVGERQEAGEEAGAARIQCRAGKRLHRLLVGGVGRGPVGVELALAHRFLEGRLDALAIGLEPGGIGVLEQLDRPGADQKLVEQILVVAIRRRVILDLAASGTDQAAPALHLARPFLRHVCEHGEARTCVLSALGVVGGGCQHRARPMLRTLCIGLVEGAGGNAEPLGFAADLVEGDEPVVAIEGGILQTFGHHRTAVLLQLHRETKHAGAVEAALRFRGQAAGQQVMQEVEYRGVDDRVMPARLGESPGEGAPVCAVLVGVELDIGAIDRKAGDDLLDRPLQHGLGEILRHRILPCDAPCIAAKRIQFAGHLVFHDAYLAVIDDGRELGVEAGEFLVSGGEALLAGRVDQHAEHQVGEVVAGGAFDLPVLA